MCTHHTWCWRAHGLVCSNMYAQLPCFCLVKDYLFPHCLLYTFVTWRCLLLPKQPLTCPYLPFFQCHTTVSDVHFRIKHLLRGMPVTFLFSQNLRGTYRRARIRGYSPWGTASFQTTFGRRRFSDCIPGRVLAAATIFYQAASSFRGHFLYTRRRAFTVIRPIITCRHTVSTGPFV